MDLPSPSQPRNPEVRFLYGLRRGKTTLGLESTRRLLALLGHPERRVHLLQVAGTNGKGSTTAYAAAALQSAGWRVGRFTSPHLLRVEERIAVDGVPVAPADFRRRVRELRPYIERAGASFFEAMTALAVMHFADSAVDGAVFEVGLGGRLDSTTALPASVTVITSIGHDHQAILGPRTQDILREKLGIVRPGVPLFAALDRAAWRDQAREHCWDRGSPLHLLPEHAARVVDLDLDGMRFELAARPGETLWTRFLGAHHARNAALAFAAAAALLRRAGEARRLDPVEAAARAFLPARLQRLQGAPGDPPVVADVGHNPEALNRTLDVIEAIGPRRRAVLVLGMMRDKQLGAAATRLHRVFAHLVLTRPHVKRAWDLDAAAAELRRAAPAGVAAPVECVEDPVAAWKHAMHLGGAPIFWIGSHYLVGEMLPALAARAGVPVEHYVTPPLTPARECARTSS